MLSVLGTETFTSTGDFTRTLTIPAGTKAVICSHGTDWGNPGTMVLGGLSATVHTYDQNDINYWLDISDRSSDDLVVVEDNGGTNYWKVLYIGGNVPALNGSPIDNQLANGTRTQTHTPPAGTNIIVFLVEHNHTIHGTPTMSANMTALQAAVVGDWDWRVGYDVGDIDEAIGAAITISLWQGNNYQSSMTSISLYEASLDVEIDPGTPLTTGPAFADDMDVERGADILVLSTLEGGTLRTGPAFATDMRIRAAGSRQVMLGGGGIETPELTEDGEEGQVLTFHAADKPTWEDATGGTGDMTSLLIDADVSGAVTVDRADAATHDLTLTDDATLTPTHSAPVAGDAIDLRILIRQDGTGGHSLAWAGAITWAGGSAPTMPSDPSSLMTVGLLSVDDGATWLGYMADQSPVAIDPATTVEDETTWGITPAVGTSTDYARADHTHGTPAEPTGSGGGMGPLLLASDHSVPIVFDDILQASDGSDFLYASEP